MSTGTDIHTTGDATPESVLNRVEEAVCALDDEWQFTFVNERAATMLEETPQNLLGKEVWRAVPGIDDRSAGDNLRRAMETQTPQRFQSYDAELDRWFNIRVYPSDDGLTIFFYDMTEERGDQLELQRKRRLFEKVFEETEDALIVADTDRRITDFNPAAERLFGYEASEVVGAETKLLYATVDEFERQGTQKFNEAAPERDKTDVIEYQRADGTVFEGETLGTPLTDPDGETFAFLGSIRDTSARIKYEQEIEGRNEALRRFHDITTSRSLSVEDQLDAVLELGAEHLGLDVGILSAIDGTEYTVEHATAPDATIQAGDRFDLNETYCSHVVEDGQLTAVAGTPSGERSTHPGYPNHAPESYIGAQVVVDGDCYGTLNFSKSSPRHERFSDGEQTFVRVLAKWISTELSRQQNKARAAANRDRLRQIIDMLPQLVFAKDRSGEFLLANQSIADAYGTTVAELEGATDADFLDSDEKARQFRDDDAAVIDTGEQKVIDEESLTTASGEEMVLRTNRIPYDPVDQAGKAVLGVATEITSLKQREVEIELQSAAMAVAMDGIAILDGDEYVYMNQAHADIFDYEPVELIGSDWRRLYDEDEIDRLETEVFPSLAEDGEWSGETVGRKRDGSAVHQDLGLSLLDSGELICTNRDITEQKDRELELERQRTRARTLFEKSPDGIIVHDKKGAVLDANETELQSLGLDRETILSMNVAEFEVGIEQSELEEIWAGMGDDEVLKVDGKHRRQNGETFPVEVWVNKVEVGGDEQYIAVSRDIAERKEREVELKRSREFIEKAQESAAIGGWEVELRSKTLEWTDEVYRIHGASPDTAVTFEEAISFYHPDDRGTITAAFERLTTEGEPYDIECRVVTRDDEVRWIRTVGDPVFDEDGNIVRARGIFQDITERREREAQLRDVKERLDLAVEGANLGVWDWNMETDAVTFNDEWATMLGLSPADIEPRLETWEDRVHPADMPLVEERLDAHIAGEAELYDCEHRMETKSGDWKWIRDVGKVVSHNEDGEPTRAVGIHLDVTEEKQSKLYLEEERDMFAEGPAVVFKWKNDDGWPVEYVSDNVSETFGYTPEQLQSGAVPYTDLIHEDDLERVVQEVDAQSDDTTERFNHEPYRMVTSDGDVRWVTDNTKIVRTDGEISHYLGYLIDITEQKRLEASLRDSEQSVRELTTVASDTGQTFEAKLGALLELGADRLDIPFGFLNRIDQGTQHVVQAVGDHPELRTGATAPESETYCRKTIQKEGTLGIHDATAEGWGDDPAYERFDLDCYIGGTVYVDGELYGSLCFADHTRREQEFGEAERAFVELLVQWTSYELASQRVETRLEAITETAQQLMSASSKADVAAKTIENIKTVLEMPVTGVWWYDEATETLAPGQHSEEARAIVGAQPTFTPGDSLAWSNFEANSIGVYDDLHEEGDRHNESTSLRSEIIVPLGDHGILSASSVEPRAFSETDIKLLEVLSSTAEAALSRAEREQMLRKTQAQLKQSNEELEQFAYAASHDLQEPLRTVSSYLTLLERRYGDDLDEDASDFIEFAVDGADRMREMIQALLTYSRVDTRSESFKPVDAAEIFEQVTQNLHVKIADVGATVSIPATEQQVAGDESQLVQLFQNLVENALKYNTETPQVDISITQDDELVRFEVSDNGIGMEADQIENIFEVFQRLHTREEFAGTGIGLAVCQKIVDRHDGEIHVDSIPDEGSTFVVTLPVAGDTDA